MNQSTLEVVLQLITILVPLSLVSVGGGLTALVELQRELVVQRGWLSEAEFAQLYALAQIVPGPNLLAASLIGWRVAGPLGAVASMLALVVPSSLLTFAVYRGWSRLARSRWSAPVVATQAGLAPLAVGLVLASSLVLATGVGGRPAGYLLTAATVAILFLSRLHPLALMLIGAAIGALGLA